jgi:hypothetical protein
MEAHSSRLEPSGQGPPSLLAFEASPIPTEGTEILPFARTAFRQSSLNTERTLAGHDYSILGKLISGFIG